MVPSFEVTVELVALTVGDGGLEVLTERRTRAPYDGVAALPGSRVRPDEDLDAAAQRVLLERGRPPLPHVEQLATYGDVGRDPRVRAVSVGYVALLPVTTGNGRASTPGAAAGRALVPVGDVASGRVPLAFDHQRITEDGTERVRAKLEYTTLAATFLPGEFTLGELRRLYEAVWGVGLHHGNFARKVRSVPGFVVATGRRRPTPGAPDLFRQGDAETMAPPLMRRSVAAAPNPPSGRARHDHGRP